MARKSAGYLFQRGEVFWLEYFANGKRIRQSLGVSTRKEADKERARIMHPLTLEDEADRRRAVADAVASAEDQARQAMEAARPKLTVANAWQAYLASGERPQSGRVTLADYASHWHKFTTWWAGHAADRPHLEQVTREDANIFVRYLKDDDLSPRRYNLIVGTCKRAFRVLAPDLGDAPNPFERIALRSLEAPARRDFTEAQVATMLARADGELRLLLALGAEAGFRLADAATLDWAAVDLAQGVIVFMPAKTKRKGKVLRLPILAGLRDLLEAIPATQRQGPVLPRTCDAYRRNRPQVSQHLTRFFKSCGFVTVEDAADPARPLSGKRRRVVLGYHSLRHYWVSHAQRHGVPYSVVMAQVGHGSPAITRGYTHVGVEQAREALAKVPSMLPTGPASRPQIGPAPVAAASDSAKVAAALARLAAGGDLVAVLADLQRILEG